MFSESCGENFQVKIQKKSYGFSIKNTLVLIEFGGSGATEYGLISSN